MAGNLVQVITILIFTFIAIIVSGSIKEDLIADTTAAINGTAPNFSNETSFGDGCYSFFNTSKCYFPESNGTSLGLGFCTEIVLPNATCESNFVVTAGATYDFVCDLFLDATDQLPPPASFYFDGECPSLYIPLDNLHSFTEEPDADSYCAASLGACTTPQTTDDGLYFDACLIGSSWKLPAPFQFYGNLCQNYTELEQLLETQKIAAEEARRWVPKDWM